MNEKTAADAKKILERLVKQGVASEAGIFADTIISPSFKTAVAQIVQSPSVFGIENNSILFEFNKDEPENIENIADE